MAAGWLPGVGCGGVVCGLGGIALDPAPAIFLHGVILSGLRGGAWCDWRQVVVFSFIIRSSVAEFSLIVKGDAREKGGLLQDSVRMVRGDY